MRFAPVLLISAAMGSTALAQSCAIASQSAVLTCLQPLMPSITAAAATCADATCACGIYSAVTACWSSYCSNFPIPTDVAGSANSICGTATATTTGGNSAATGSPTGATPSKAAAAREYFVPAGGAMGIMAALLGVIAYL